MCTCVADFNRKSTRQIPSVEIRGTLRPVAFSDTGDVISQIFTHCPVCGLAYDVPVPAAQWDAAKEGSTWCLLRPDRSYAGTIDREEDVDRILAALNTTQKPQAFADTAGSAHYTEDPAMQQGSSI